MSQFTPGSSAGQTLTKFLIGFAMVEGVLLAAIVLAMVFDVITTGQMIPLIVAVALVGGVVMTWRVLTLNKQNQAQAKHTSQFPQSGLEHDGTDGNRLSDLGQKDPMAKYRDPNR